MIYYPMYFSINQEKWLWVKYMNLNIVLYINCLNY
jgi:hypothetical protein